MVQKVKQATRRVIVSYWKKHHATPIEVFSSLKNFCLHHPEFSYSTLSNYLSKNKIPFENDVVRIERQNVIATVPERIIEPVVRKRRLLHDNNEEMEDLDYWLTKTPIERLAAVTFLVNQTLSDGEKMDKTSFVKRKRMHI